MILRKEHEEKKKPEIILLQMRHRHFMKEYVLYLQIKGKRDCMEWYTWKYLGEVIHYNVFFFNCNFIFDEKKSYPNRPIW